MTNEQYLIASYFASAAISTTLGTVLYFYLRRSFGEIAETASERGLPTILKKLFPDGLVFPALMGFISVTYSAAITKPMKKLCRAGNTL